MRELLAHINSLPNTTASEQDGVWTVSVVKAPQLEVTLTVAWAALEWFVEAQSGNEAIWDDWADYYPIDGESTEELRANMSDDIKQFASKLASREVRAATRITPSGRTREFQWLDGASWQPVSIAEGTANDH